MPQIDRLKQCPHCHTDWDGGDVLQTISRLNVFTHKSKKSLEEIASAFGYSEDNKINFSRAINIMINDVIYYQCPNEKCKHVFNSETGWEYNSVANAKIGLPIIQEDKPCTLTSGKSIIIDWSKDSDEDDLKELMSMESGLDDIDKTDDNERDISELRQLFKGFKK